MKPPVCPYCGQKSKKAMGYHIWPDYPDLAQKHVWRCRECDAYVGCHGDSWKPLGTLANKKTRAARRATHQFFDPIWKSGKMTRSEAYKRLSDLTQIPEQYCHIAMFTEDECLKAQEATKKLRTLFL